MLILALVTGFFVVRVGLGVGRAVVRSGVGEDDGVGVVLGVALPLAFPVGVRGGLRVDLRGGGVVAGRWVSRVGLGLGLGLDKPPASDAALGHPFAQGDSQTIPPTSAATMTPDTPMATGRPAPLRPPARTP